MAEHPRDEDLLLLKDKVFQAAKDNQPQVIRDCLASLHPDVVKDVLHHCSTYREGVYTPLTIAALKGQLDVVELLVDDYKTDVNQTVSKNLKMCNALFSAVHSGCLEVVRVLVRNGCDVNAVNRIGRTPLMSACLKNYLDVVKLLVESGAQIDETADEGMTTCLMKACETRSLDIAKYLLSKGVDPNRQNWKGRTALHEAAGKDASDIVALLLHHGARSTKDMKGLCPLLEAAKNRATHAMNVFIWSPNLSQTEKIEALELLGARVATTNVDAAFIYVRLGMKERFKNPQNVQLKPHSPLPTLTNVQESQTLEELQARRSDQHLFRLECLAIVSRILGPRNTHTLQTFIEYFVELKSTGCHRLATRVLLHGLKAGCAGPRTDVYTCHHTDLFLGNFAKMLRKNMSDFFPDVEDVLKLTFDVMEMKKGRLNFVSALDISVCLYHFLFALKVARGQEEGRRLQRLVESFVLLTSGSPLLHTAVECRWYSPFWIPIANILPFDKLVPFLVYCGADVHFKDDEKNTALHIVALLSQNGKHPDLLRAIMKVLLRAGALPGVENSDGKTPLDLAAPALAAELRELYPVSLKSLAATAVVKRKILHVDEIPQDLMEFVEKH